MTGGFLCDTPDCGCFTPKPHGTWVQQWWSHEKQRYEKFEAHLCGDCATEFSKTLGFRPEDTDENAA